MAEDKDYKMQSNPQGLKGINYEIPSDASKWNPEYFFEAYSGLNDLKEIDPSKKEGLDTLYGILTDPVARKLDPNKAKDNLVGLVNSALSESSLSNAKGLTGILNEQTSGSLAMEFQGFYDDNSSETYRNVASSVTNAQNVAQDIESAPDAYFEKRLEGLDKDSKGYWSLFKDEVLEADLSISQEKAIEAMRNSGSPQDYLAENLTTAKRLADSYKTEVEELQERKQKAFKDKIRELGTNPTHYDIAELNEKFAEEEKEMAEKYKQNIEAAQAFPKMMGTVMNLAYQTIKKEKEEAKKGGSDNGDSGE